MARIGPIEAGADAAINGELIRAPRYQQIYSLLRGWIFDGTFPPGSKLPAETELCETFGVSKNTTSKAIDMLAVEKLLIRVRGKGTYVTEDLGDAPNFGDMEELIRKTRRLAQKSSVRKVEIREIAGEDEVCADLDLAPRTPVYRISFVRYMQNKPIGYCDYSVPVRSGLTFTVEDVKRNQMLSLLETKGIRMSGADQLIGAQIADTTEAALLATAVGTPLVHIRLVVFNEAGKPAMTGIASYLADRYQHHVYLTRRPGRQGRTPRSL